MADASDKKQNFTKIGNMFANYQVKESSGYITQEFQDYGYRLAVELNDLKHKSLYIKMAKDTDRSILEQARSFVIDADHAKSKARLFMWKVKQIKTERKKKEKKEAERQGTLF